MQNINSVAQLKMAIKLSEVDRDLKEQILKAQFIFIRESIRPANLIKNGLNKMVSSPNLINNILGTVLGLATGYMSKKIVVGTSTNILRRVLGNILQFGVAKAVVKNTEGGLFQKERSQKFEDENSDFRQF
jgi:hypothetical protein